MPIYEYRCTSCGHQQEFLQKVNAVPLSVCTECGKPTFSKLVTAAGFQLKGSGWYATDFKGSGKAPGKPAGAKADAKPADAKADAKPAEAKKDGPASGCGGGGCACH